MGRDTHRQCQVSLPDICAAQSALDVGSVEAIEKAGRSIHNAFIDTASNSCAELSEGIAALLPPKHLVLEPAILRSPELQNTLFELVDVMAASPLQASAADVLGLLRSYEHQLGRKLPDMEARTDLTKVRKSVKMCIGVDYTMRQVTRHLPASSADFAKHAALLVKSLAEKGIGATRPVQLPGYLSDVLLRMQAPLVQPEEEQAE